MAGKQSWRRKIMSEETIQKELLNQLAEIIEGQRTLYVGQRNLELKIKDISSQLVMMKFTLNEDVVKKVNVLIDDMKALTIGTKTIDSKSQTIFEEFFQARNNLTVEDRNAFEKAKREAENSRNGE
jgi:hypothetical protein